MQRIVPCLWFDRNCEEAVNFYIDTFTNAPQKRGESKIISIQRYEEGMNTPSIENMLGKVITAIFELDGHQFMALDGGPTFKLSEAVSFQIECADQKEVDYFWSKLTADGGEESVCGWLKDAFGLSWQVVPKQLGEMLQDPDKEKALRVMNAMLQMKKIDVPTLQKAYDGE
jgi:predicted 3-demethylubiquinone-9 3-methyltransferase (glyoxalase superfamily)